jgi:hypothetical protein
MRRPRYWTASLAWDVPGWMPSATTLLAADASEAQDLQADGGGGKDPQQARRPPYYARHDEDGARAELQYFVADRPADEVRIGMLDETGLLEEGSTWVGVKRQYTGATGAAWRIAGSVYYRVLIGRRRVRTTTSRWPSMIQHSGK